MLKSLKLLKKYKEIFLDVTIEEHEDFDEIGINFVNQIQEAISELEALQQPKSCECFEDVIFVWNETSNFIESIVINTEDLALDVNKNYKVCIVELKEQ